MLKEKLQSYFDVTNRKSNVENSQSLRFQFNEVFELGEDFENGTLGRINAATNKAVGLFEKVFKNSKEIFTVIYEFPEPNIFNASNEYLHKQFKERAEKEIIENLEEKIIIYKTLRDDINFHNILKAIANTEMGFEPAVDQKIFFFDIQNDKAFYMYDDRGCITNGL